MITGDEFIAMALSFPGTEQHPHRERIAIKVIGRRIFTTYLAAHNTANIFLTPREQALFCEIEPLNIFPLPNKWGVGGVTTFVLNAVTKEIVMDALLSAYNEVVKPKEKPKTKNV